MMLASASTSSRIRVAASSTSKQRQIVAAGDGDEQASLRPFIEDSSSSGLAMAASAACCARFSPLASPGTHHRLAHAAHHGANVGEVEVDETLPSPSASVMQATPEYSTWSAIAKASAKVVWGIGNPEQVLVRNDDQCIDAPLQFLNTGIGDPHTACAFELERFGHHTYPSVYPARGAARAMTGAGAVCRFHRPYRR